MPRSRPASKAMPNQCASWFSNWRIDWRSPRGNFWLDYRRHAYRRHAKEKSWGEDEDPAKEKAMSTIVTDNRGKLIVSSTYWGSEYEKAGKVFVSVNAGAIRVMVPTTMHKAVDDWRAAKYAILSRGPWPEQSLPEAVEILWEDGSDNPYALHLPRESFDHLPSEPPAGRDWLITVWQLKEGKPHKALERTCYWRRVERLPWLKPLKN